MSGLSGGLVVPDCAVFGVFCCAAVGNRRANSHGVVSVAQHPCGGVITKVAWVSVRRRTYEEKCDLSIWSHLLSRPTINNRVCCVLVPFNKVGIADVAGEGETLPGEAQYHKRDVTWRHSP